MCDEPPIIQTHPELYALAERAYHRCVEWFGEPLDPQIPYVLLWADRGCCTYDGSVPEYRIQLPRGHTEIVQHCAIIGHEMYHRVTGQFQTMRRVLWIDEMLASLTEFHNLEQEGFKDYAKMLGNLANEAPDAMKPMDLTVLVRKSRAMLQTEPPYPPGFGASIERLALKFERVVGWEQMRLLAKAETMDDWLKRTTNSRDTKRELLRLLSAESTD